MCAVKTSKKDIIVPQRSIKPIKTRANTGFIATHNTPAIFEPEITGGFPDGLQLAETLVMLKRGVTQILQICIENTTDHDIRLRNNTLIGHLQLVQSVTPMEVEEMEKPCDTTAEKVFENSQPTREFCPSEIKLDRLTSEQELTNASRRIAIVFHK